MDVTAIIVLCGVIIFFGFAGELIFRKTNIPDVIWLIVFGIVIKNVFRAFDPGQSSLIANVFTTFALIFILFEGALNIKIRELFRGVFSGSMLAVINFTATVVLVTFIFVALHHSWQNGILMGAIIGGTSSAVVIPLTKNLTIKKETAAALTLESAITDVLCIVSAITIMQVIGIGSFSLTAVSWRLLWSFIFAGVIGAFAALLWLVVLTRIIQTAKSYMITIAFMFVLYGLVEVIGSSGPIACLAYGLVLGNADRIFKVLNRDEYTSIKTSERFFYSEISFILKSFFFVYLGMVIDFSDWKPFLFGLIITVALFLARPLSTWPLTRRINVKDRAVIESMVPKGLAAAILAQMPAQLGIPGTEFFSGVVLAVVLWSILGSTVLVYLAEQEIFTGFSGIFKKKVASTKLAIDPDKK